MITYEQIIALRIMLNEDGGEPCFFCFTKEQHEEVAFLAGIPKHIANHRFDKNCDENGLLWFRVDDKDNNEASR